MTTSRGGRSHFTVGTKVSACCVMTFAIAIIGSLVFNLGAISEFNEHGRFLTPRRQHSLGDDDKYIVPNFHDEYGMPTGQGIDLRFE